MPTQGEIIRELAQKLERQVILLDLLQIRSMEELQAYIERLKDKTEK